MIQKFCYHGNLTSHFSLSMPSLLRRGLFVVLGRLERKKKRERACGARRRGEREPNLISFPFSLRSPRALYYFYWEQRSMHTSILRSVLVASRVTLPNRDGKIYIRDSDFKLPRLMSYLNCSTITSVFLLTIASHADVLMGSSRVRGYIDQSSRQISARENRLVIVKLDLDLVKDMMS